MRIRFIITVVFVLLMPAFSPAQKITISGYVKNDRTSELLLGANVYTPNTLQGTSSNNFGYFALSVPSGNFVLRVSCVGYAPFTLTGQATKDTTLNIGLNEGHMLDEVTVSATMVRSEVASPLTLSSKQIRLLPNLTGEADLLKAFQFLPGIAQGGEGNNSLYVRGGSPDQNLILLDDVPLYYVNHIGGLVSIFDEYAVSDISVYKSGFPARFGGRLSSVVDVRMKNGKMDKLGGEIAVGLVSSKLSLEGPIIKDKMSFMLSARKSMTDLYMRPISGRTLMENDGFMVYSFYDLNGKINYKLSENDRFYLSFYRGTDKVRLSVGYDSEGDTFQNFNEYNQYKFGNESSNGWGNTMGCFRWNHLFGPKLFSNLTLAISDYFYETRSHNEITVKKTDLVSETFLYNYKSGVFDRLAKIDFDYYPTNNQHIRFGGMANYHRFNTGKLHQLYHVDEAALPDSSLRAGYMAEMDTTYGSAPMNALETTVYIETDLKLHPKLAINAGLHMAAYHYSENNFFSWQPRVALKWNMGHEFTATASYASMAQFIHMLTGSDTSMPTDIWVPATNQAKPEKSDQYSIGIEKGFTALGLKASAELFYKTMTGQIDYKLGTNLVSGSDAWYNKIETGGKGTVYGAEALIEKTKGKLTGWVSYTLSKNTRQFDNINNGNIYPYVYDRPHDFSVVANFKLNERVTFSGTWEYRSGRRMTLGAAAYDANVLMNSIKLMAKPAEWTSERYRQELSEWTNEPATIYGTKNNYKLDDYHKLCLNTHFTKQRKHGVRTFTVGLNNVYNQKNAYNVYYEIEKDVVYLKKMTLFPIMPSLSYSYRF